MRLDEWQKYIDSQFLEEEPEPVPAPKAAQPIPPASQVVVEAAKPDPLPKETADAETITQAALFTAVFAEEPVPAAPMLPESAPVTVQNMVTMVVTPLPSPVLPPAGRAPRIEVLTPLPETASEPKIVIPVTEEVTNRTRRRSQAAESSSASRSDASEAVTPIFGLFEPIADLDADIPVFQRYLPSSHAAAMPAEIPPTPNLQTRTPLSPETAQTQGDSIEKPIDVQIEVQIEEQLEEETEEHNDLPADSSLDRVRRAPKSRARHARNVRPENVPSGLSAAELWAAVPRHVQTLLSLERLEEKEVAQFSYKRQFQEKRHELIERLLDPILSLEDTARLLNVCPTTVRRYTNKGILTYYRKEPERSLRNRSESHGGETAVSNEAMTNEKETRQRRFRLSDILAFLETQQSAIESDRQAEHQAERRRLARAAGVIAAPALEPNAVSDTSHTGKDS